MSEFDEIAKIADIPVQLEIELDRTAMSIRSILGLKQGSLIRMSRSAGENIDLLLGTTVIGFGEIVVINDRMGVRVTDLAAED